MQLSSADAAMLRSVVVGQAWSWIGLGPKAGFG